METATPDPTERPKAGEVETRQAEVATEGRKIRGVLPCGVESRDMGGWKEVIEPTALRGTKLDDLVARVDHTGVPIGRYPTTLDVFEDPRRPALVGHAAGVACRPARGGRARRPEGR